MTDDEALAALRRVAELEGIIPALESSHAVAWVLATRDAGPDTLDLICLSGRGDKDLAEVLPEAWHRRTGSSGSPPRSRRRPAARR